MKTMISVVAALALSAASVNGAFCHGKPAADAPANTHPINTEEAKLVRKSKNAILFEAGQPGYEFHVLHVYGTAYERGFGQGDLMKIEANELVDGVWQYMESQVIDGAGLQQLPVWLQDLIADVGLDIALDVTYDWTKNFTGDYIYQEMQGLADGGNISFTKLRNIHLIGSLTQGDCSMFGAWGSATVGEKSIQLRALDWETSNPFRQHPAVLVEHPTDGGHAYASVGFIGWLGALSGMSEAQLAISEIGIAFPDSTFGNESRVGIPFTFLLRDILQFDATIDDSIRRIQNANRTCDLVLGVGDGKAPHGPGAGSEDARTDGSDLPVVGPVTSIEYSYSVANFQNPKNNAPFNNTWHPYTPDIVKQFMDWNCPGFQETGTHQLQKFHGQITPANTISDIVARTQTGSTHVAVYDLTDSQMYVSFLERVNATVEPHDLFAYERQYTQFDMKALFAVKQ